jgi:hypothetical protein
METQQLAWGIGFAGMMYVIGNGVWTNHLARRRIWMGWLMWLVAAAVVIIAGAFIDIRLSGSQSSVWQHLSSVDKENHWIALTLFALMSVPGAASVILKQPSKWTRLALTLPAIAVFIPVGMQLGNGVSSITEGLGLAFVIAALVFAWQFMLDSPPPEQQRKPS